MVFLGDKKTRLVSSTRYDVLFSTGDHKDQTQGTNDRQRYGDSFSGFIASGTHASQMLSKGCRHDTVDSWGN